MTFMNTWVALFAVLAAIPAYCTQRLIMQSEYVNGNYGLLTYCLAQLLVGLPFNLVAAFVYQLGVHWIVGYNYSAEAYFYAVLMSWLLLLAFEAIILSICEALRSPMLSAVSQKQHLLSREWQKAQAGSSWPKRSISPS